MLSADNLCKQFGPTEWSEFKLLDTDGIPDRIFEQISFEKMCWRQKACKITQ